MRADSPLARPFFARHARKSKTVISWTAMPGQPTSRAFGDRTDLC
jgi:hypothetical protein